jgi:hypothetical protein
MCTTTMGGTHRSGEPNGSGLRPLNGLGKKVDGRLGPLPVTCGPSVYVE